ncbi:MAG: flavin reductase family protein [Eubacteriales Family XIII. Incertae Sedis bacterium]|nr:MAG: flavin reductase family protein [Clostridiales Family XIII bacterium]
MAKISLKPGTMLNPVPVVMVSCGDQEKSNIITIAWTGIVNSNPPMTYIAVQRSRYSYNIIKEHGEFVINLVTQNLVRACDYCGVRSGAATDKWKETKLTPVAADIVKAPLISESPVNIECRVKEILEYPSHVVFVSEIAAVHVDSDLMDKSGKIRFEDAGLIVYNHGLYMPVQKKVLGTFGFSVMKPKTQKKRAAARRNASRMKQKSE